jgi:hypothetical protein
MNSTKYAKYVSLLLVLFLIPIVVSAKSGYMVLIPDKGANFGCATCHISPAGGPLNPFGQDWENIAIPAGNVYTLGLADKDSDGDTFINDVEFGAKTNPGDPASKPTGFFTILTKTDDEHGTIIPSGAVKVAAGANQTFVITPNPGHHIDDVKVDDVSVGAVSTYTFTNVNSDHSIFVYFHPYKYIITAQVGEHGTITPLGTAEVEYGGSQTYTITPDVGYLIKDVLVDGVSVGPVATYTFSNVTGDHYIEADFILGGSYIIIATAGINGTITPSGQLSIPVGGSQTFKITPDAGHHIENVMVDGVSVGAVSTYTFSNVTANHTINANFAINVDTNIIIATAGEHGSITPSGQVDVLIGGNQTFTITPDAGYHIKDVIVDGTSMGAVSQYTFTNVIVNHTIGATFAINTYLITATAGEHGSITPSGQVDVLIGGNQTFTITPDAGYHIEDVMVDGASVGAVSQYTFNNVTTDHTINATFAINVITHIITATAGEHGSISPSGEIGVLTGEAQTFTIAPDADYHILDVFVDGASVGAVDTYTFTNVAANHTINATFTIDTYIITATAGEHGKITPSGQVRVAHGDSKTFTIIPDVGYHILDVIVDGDSVGTVDSYTFTNVTTEHTISVTFVASIYTLTATAGDHGSITPSGEIKVEYGKNQVFTMTPDEGYHVKTVVVDNSPGFPGNSYTFTNVMADHTINVEFELNTYLIITKAGEHGKITPSGEVNVNHGSNQTFAITPDAGYVISNVSVDAKSAGRVSSYTFENVIANHFIEANFLAITGPTPELSVTPSSYDFGHVKIADSSDPLIITISNIGDAELNISGKSLSDKKYFSIDLSGGPTPCQNESSVIAPGSSCTVAITFRPLSLGEKEAVFTITSDDPYMPSMDIMLSGSGTGIRGDVSEDGFVRSNDAILTLRIATALITPSDYQKWAGDMNDDGSIKSNDAILILRASAGLAAPSISGIMKNTNKVNVVWGKPKNVNDRDFVVPLEVDDTTGLAGGDIQITYDNAILQAVGISSSDPDVLMVSNVNEQGIIHIAFAAKEKISHKTLVEIQFQRLDDGTFKLRFDNVELYGLDASPIIGRGIDTEFKSQAIIPKGSSLLQNFPNPFNPETWIPYQLNLDSDLVIGIYNASGNLIRTLNLGYRPTGFYTTKDKAAYWDGKNEAGEEVASGIYFYTIQAGDFTATKKMVVKK